MWNCPNHLKFDRDSSGKITGVFAPINACNGYHMVCMFIVNLCIYVLKWYSSHVPHNVVQIWQKTQRHSECLPGHEEVSNTILTLWRKVEIAATAKVPVTGMLTFGTLGNGDRCKCGKSEKPT